MIRKWALLIAPAGLLVATSAAAQDQDLQGDLIIQPTIPQGLNRDRNVSVEEQARPDYSPVGVPIGAMILSPRVEVGSGATSNTYFNPNEAVASVFLLQRASATLRSQWSRHSLRLSASTTSREYVGESRRNEHLWSADAVGRLDVSRALRIDADVNASRRFENLFSTEVSPRIAALSEFRRDYASVQASYTQGRMRSFVLLDYAEFRFEPVPLLGGGDIDQGDRDRKITRLTGQVEYARSPSVSFFTQLSATRTTYDQDPRSGLPKPGSKTTRLLGGVNVDIAGQIRGTIGVGYSIRDYNSALYRDIHGLSAEIEVETFPTSRLTIGMSAQRRIQDSARGNLRPSFNTSIGLRTDYELLRNLILSGATNYSHQPTSGDTYGASASGRFLASRRVSLYSTLRYTRRSADAVSDARIEVAIAYQL
jgi:hypothetical protein